MSFLPVLFSSNFGFLTSFIGRRYLQYSFCDRKQIIGQLFHLMLMRYFYQEMLMRYMNCSIISLISLECFVSVNFVWLYTQMQVYSSHDSVFTSSKKSSDGTKLEKKCLLRIVENTVKACNCKIRNKKQNENHKNPISVSL